jgi:hypothetical protein
MAAVLAAARLCEPPSGLHVAEAWYGRIALCDLPQLDADLVDKDRLYRALDLVLERGEPARAYRTAAAQRRRGSPPGRLRHNHIQGCPERPIYWRGGAP